MADSHSTNLAPLPTGRRQPMTITALQPESIPHEIQQHLFVGSNPEETLRNIAAGVLVLNCIGTDNWSDCERGMQLILDGLGCAAQEVAWHMKKVREGGES